MSHLPQNHIAKAGEHISKECSAYFYNVLGHNQPMEHSENDL